MFKKFLGKFAKSGSNPKPLAAEKSPASKVERVLDKQSLLLMLADSRIDIAKKQAALKLQTEQQKLRELISEIKHPELIEQAKRQLINSFVENDLAALSADELLDVVLHHKQAKLRQLALRLLPHNLYELVCRESNDKIVLRLARQQLATLRAADEHIAKRNLEMNKIIERLNALGGRVHIDPLWHGKYQRAIADWQELLKQQAADAEQTAAYNAALQSCAEDLNTLAAMELTAKTTAEVANLEQQLQTFLPTAYIDDSAIAPQIARIDQLLQAIGTSGASVDVSNLERAKTDLLCLQADLEQLQNRVSNIHLLLAEYENTREAEDFDLPAMIEKLQRESTDWQSSLPRPAQFAKLDALLKELKTQQSQIQQQRKGELARAHKRLQQLALHIERDEYKIAHDIHEKFSQRILPKLNAMATAESEKLCREYAHLSQEFAKLADFYAACNQPLRQNLLMRMQELHAARMAPIDKSRAYKQLQRKWRELGVGDDELAAEFAKLSEQVRIPLDEFFATRQANINKILQDLAQMTVELDEFIKAQPLSALSSHELQNIIKTARGSWQKYMPLHHAQVPELSRNFYAKLDIINAELKQRYRASADDKAALLSRAEVILAQLKANATINPESLTSALDELQKLQQNWRALGKTFQSREQKLWKKFNDCCNQAFAMRGELRAQQDSELAEYSQKLAEVIADLFELNHTSAELDSRAEAIIQSDLPAFFVKKLQAQWQGAKRDLAKLKQKQREQSALEAAARFDAAYQLLAVAEHHFLAGEAFTLDSAAFAELSLAEQDLLAPRIAFLLAPQQIEASELDARQQQLLQLAIEFEVLVDAPSPAEFSQARREYQLACLGSEGVGTKNQHQLEQELAAIKQQWLQTGACPNRAAIDARFTEALAAYKAMAH